MAQNINVNLMINFFGIKKEIKKLNSERYKDNLTTYKEYYCEISNRTPKQSTAVMSFHRMVSTMGLALYRIMKDENLSKEKSIELIHKFLWRGPYGKNVRFVSFFIRRTRDPFTTFLKILGPFNEWFFPCPPWEKKRVDIENGVGWHQKKCYFYDFFKNEGSWELCGAYGDCDCRVAELFPNVLELKREKALCRGDEYCDFLFYKR